ncbi:hypothetical protein GCK72_005562 [Caenorhabditis remanei]|uniref:Uncharacterized protein n=1 Tax=Caenorhabditis remanei TaxID=31234 RepID=A0A6A5HER9_CAERE|nr:hypothetical protein GCK72_005562 [Caenorhabditis remanei]KAF1765609.1 hypothetical protein GCK72_005562 [Caenorhabditis remanei]
MFFFFYVDVVVVFCFCFFSCFYFFFCATSALSAYACNRHPEFPEHQAGITVFAKLTSVEKYSSRGSCRVQEHATKTTKRAAPPSKREHRAGAALAAAASVDTSISTIRSTHHLQDERT